jgi:hypothetical protein
MLMASLLELLVTPVGARAATLRFLCYACAMSEISVHFDFPF